MNLRKLILTKNANYIAGGTMIPRGILVHSTAVNNPYLKRYVGPDDGLLGINKYGNHWNTKYPDGRKICAHGFIGKLADGSIATYQTLPWNMPGWHSGSGSKGSKYNANNTGYIGFEICEDDRTDPDYFNKVYTEAVELCAYLCREYDIKPESPYLICHSEGHKLGIASNHSDVMHWFPKFGKSMDTFRADVKKLLDQDDKITESSTINPTSVSNEKLIYEYLSENTEFNCAAISGILANLKAESDFKSNNLQQSYEKKLGYSDTTYSDAVDNGTYKNFVRDSAGYGLIQWTYWSRKQGLLAYAQSKRTSISDYKMQLDYMIKELKNYKNVWRALTTCEDTEQGAYECGRIFCYEFEAPSAKETAQVTRGNKAKEYYKKYYNTKINENNVITDTSVSYEDIDVGDILNFISNKQYVSANTSIRKSATPTKVKVTRKYKSSAKHPIHVRAVDSKGNFVKGVYGWVDISDLQLPVFVPYQVKVIANKLNYRKGPGTSYTVQGVIEDKGVYTIVQEENGWGQLKSKVGWISLKYTKKVEAGRSTTL